VQFLQQGKTITAVALGPPHEIGDGIEEILVEVPQSVILGIAEFRVVRLDKVIEPGECTGQFVKVERALFSNSMRLSSTANYVVAAMRGADDVVIFTQGDPSSANPPATLNEVAHIPVGINPRQTALTDDHTRAYVTNSGYPGSFLERPPGDATVSIIDLIALQEIDLIPGNAVPTGSEPIDRIVLPNYSRPYHIALDPANTFAYVADQDVGAVYVIDINPKSPTFNRHVHTVTLPPDATRKGLRGLVVGEDGRRLYVAATNADLIGYPRNNFTEFSSVFVINVDPADHTTNFGKNPNKYWEVIAQISMEQPGIPGSGQDTYALTRTGDPKRIAFTNRQFDSAGFGWIEVIDDSPHTFQAHIARSLELTLGSVFDTLDVNNASDVVFLPENAFQAVIGEHPTYAIVAGNNRYIFRDPSHDPDAFIEGTGDLPLPGGSTIGFIRDPFDIGAKLVAATTPVPMGMAESLAFASGYNYLFADYLGAEVGLNRTGAVFVYYLVTLINQIEKTLAGPDAWKLDRFQVERFDPRFPGGSAALLPLQEDLGLLNTLYDIKADYRITSANFDALRFTYSVPALKNLDGSYQLDQFGNKILSPSAPFAVGSLPQGLSSHFTQTAAGPLVWNSFDLGRGVGLRNLEPYTVGDAIRETLGGPVDCNDQKFNSEVQLDTGAVVERHDLVTYHALGQPRGVSLTYDSTTADARPIINFGWEGILHELPAYAQDPLANIPLDELPLLEVQITFAGAGGSLTGATHYWRIPAGADNIAAAVQTDLSSLPSGYYNYTIMAKLAGVERQSGGRLLHINSIDSVFGRGWGVKGLQELYEDANGSVTVVDGSGDGQRFERVDLPADLLKECPDPDPTKAEVYRTLPGDNSKLVRTLPGPGVPDGNFLRTMDDGTVFEFSRQKTGPDGKVVPGKLVKVTDRYGNATRYEYDTAGRIQKIVDPVGLETRFVYSGDHVSAIVDPAGRVTRLG
jgi:YD repeat-containing protein